MTDQSFSGETGRGAPPRKFFDPGNGWITPVEKFMVSVLVVFAFGAIAFMSWAAWNIDRANDGVDQNSADLAAAVGETAENRAIGCQLLVALAQPLPASCMEPEVLKHYDPNAVAPPTRTTGLICEIGLSVGIPEQDLPPVCAEVDGDD